MNRSIIGLLGVGLMGCAFAAVEHVSHIEAGALLGVTLRVSGGGSVSGSAAICAGLPVGWTVEGARYAGSVSGSDTLSGTAIEDPQAAIQFGVRPDVVWSCWTHAGTEEWGDASVGVVNMDIRVAVDASGPHPLMWSLGTTGLTGELLSAMATSTVRVDSPGHPLDGASQVASGSDGDAVIGIPTGFLSVGELGVSTSTDGIEWSVAGVGLAGLAGASYGGDTLWAWTDDALLCWTQEEAWQPIDIAWATESVDAVAVDSGLLVVGGETSTLRHIDRIGAQARMVPVGAEPGGLTTSGAHAVWRLWNDTLRQPELRYSQDAGSTWSTVSGPALPQAVGQYDRVGVSSTGSMLWVNVASTPAGAHASVWLGGPSGEWQGMGAWPVGELAPTTTPVACDGRWVLGLPWGGWLAVDDRGTVSRHALARSADGAEYLCSGDVLTVIEDGNVAGVASWIDAPDLGELTLPVAVVGDAYNTRVGLAEWDTTVDGLPDGLSLIAGQLLGVPTVSGAFDLHVQARDEWSRMDDRRLTLLVDEADVDVLDDPGTNDVDGDHEVGTDVVLADEDTDGADQGDSDATASVDIQPTSGCSSVSGPSFLIWPTLFLLLGLRRRQ